MTTQGGRKQDSIWLQFERVIVPGKSGCRAICKSCNKEMMGIVSRMKDHYNQCNNINPVVPACPEPIEKPFPWMAKMPKKEASKSSSLSTFLTKTTSSEKHAIDLQLARFIYATNCPFNLVEYNEFKRLCEMLRPR